VYNYENKMVGITYPDSSLNTFSYDGDGKRLQKQDSTGTLRMVFDPQGPTGLYDLAKETDGSNNLVAFYTQGPMLISMRRNSASYFYHPDALGSTSAITSSDETVTSTYKYYAFGDELTSTGTLNNAFKYVGGLGYYSDPDSGLLLLRARYYWPGVARFLTMDPAREGSNWYVYVRNRAIAQVDPTGVQALLGPPEVLRQERGGMTCTAGDASGGALFSLGPFTGGVLVGTTQYSCYKGWIEFCGTASVGYTCFCTGKYLGASVSFGMCRTCGWSPLLTGTFSLVGGGGVFGGVHWRSEGTRCYAASIGVGGGWLVCACVVRFYRFIYGPYCGGW
jgi:RHS repeat-associated protein